MTRDAMTQLTTARSLLAEAVHSEPAAVPEDARIGSFERWDSLAHMRLVLAVEARIGRELDAEEVVRIECLDDIRAILESTKA